MKNDTLYTVQYHYNNIPKILRIPMRKWFMKHHSEVVKIFNECIVGVNSVWDLTGEPASLGDFIEDINPKYVKLIQNTIQPAIDKSINRKAKIFKYSIDQYGDIIGKVSFLQKSKLFVSFKQVEP